MPLYFFHIIILACLVFHFFFGKSRIRQIEKVPLPINDRQSVEIFVKSNITFSVLSISACFLVALIYSFIPDWNYLLFPIKLLDSKVLDYIGMFFVKIAFIGNVVVYFRIIDKFSFEFADLTIEKIMKMELLIQLTTVLLSAGVFIFMSSLVSLLIFVSTISFFVYSRSKSRAI